MNFEVANNYRYTEELFLNCCDAMHIQTKGEKCALQMQHVV